MTIWVALDLLFAKAVTNELTIERPSQEDLQAAVHNPDWVFLGLPCRAQHHYAGGREATHN